MPKALWWLVGGFVGVALLVAAGLVYAPRLMSQRAVTPRPLGSPTPAAVSLPFTRVAIPSGDHTLIGWWVRAPGDSGKPAPAVLFLHGNASSIADYVTVQRVLYRQGISSLVFDYTGFGASGGTASLRSAVADAGRAAAMLADSAGRSARRVGMGSGLGATVLLQAIDSVQPLVQGIVVEGVDASVKEAAVRSGRLPRLAARILPDPADNVSAAARVRVPLLVVQSGADTRSLFVDAERVAAAVPGQAAIVKHWRPGHSAIVVSGKSCDWAPIVAFVKTGSLPATRVDSTDVCAAEKAVADSARARAAVQAAVQTRAARRSTTAKSGVGTGTPPAPPAKAPPAKAPPAKAPAPTKRP